MHGFLSARSVPRPAVGSTKRPPPGRSISSNQEPTRSTRMRKISFGLPFCRSPTIRPTGIVTNTGLTCSCSSSSITGRARLAEGQKSFAPSGKRPREVRCRVRPQRNPGRPFRRMARIHEVQLERGSRHHQPGWDEGSFLHGPGSAARWISRRRAPAIPGQPGAAPEYNITIPPSGTLAVPLSVTLPR